MPFKRLNSLLWWFGGSVPRNRGEITKLLDATHKHTQLLPAGEIAMLKNILELPQLRVEEIIIHYGKVDWLNNDDTYAEILTKIAETNHSRYPVLHKEDNKVTGILHVKRLVGLKAEPQETILADAKLLQPARIVPESKGLDSMLREFQYYRLHMMVVADEAGHPCGVVTIEDVLEKIVGAIRDEFDASEGHNTPIKLVKPNLWEVQGQADLGEFNRTFGLKLDEERCETIGGWVAYKLGRLPKSNEIVTEGNLTMRVTVVDERQVNSLEVERTDASPAGDK